MSDVAVTSSCSLASRISGSKPLLTRSRARLTVSRRPPGAAFDTIAPAFTSHAARQVSAFRKSAAVRCWYGWLASSRTSVSDPIRARSWASAGKTAAAGSAFGSGGLAGGRRGALRLGDRLRGRLADFVDDARHLGDAGADRGSQAAPPRNQLIARAGASHEERLQDAVRGDRLAERRQRGSRRKFAGVDVPCGDLPDHWSGR